MEEEKLDGGVVGFELISVTGRFLFISDVGLSRVAMLMALFEGIDVPSSIDSITCISFFCRSGNHSSFMR